MTTVNPVTINEVNDALLVRLNTLIQEADPAQILDLAEAVAKLNASLRNNNQFAVPQSEEEKTEAMLSKKFSNLSEAITTQGN